VAWAAAPAALAAPKIRPSSAARQVMEVMAVF
jgi:hypothetical protein